jgi:antitoxin HicB
MSIEEKTEKSSKRYASFDDYLKQHGIFGDVKIAVEKRLVALQIEEERKSRKLTKGQLAEMVGTSRAQLDRVLDPNSQNITIDTLKRVAAVLGKRLHIELVDT